MASSAERDLLLTEIQYLLSTLRARTDASRTHFYRGSRI